MRTILVVWLLVCVGCGGGEGVQPDAAPAPSPDARPTVEVDGKVFATVAFQLTAVEGAPVELRAGGAVLQTATTDADGAFSFRITPPLDAYVRVATDGRLPTVVLPPHPLVGGENLLTVVADAAEVGTWYTQVGDTYAAGARTVIVAVIDGHGDALAGATVAMSPAPGGFAYYDPDAHAFDPALGSAPNGFALATTAGASVTATASVGAPRTIAPEAGALTMLAIAP
jgi:hypothetical protein